MTKRSSSCSGAAVTLFAVFLVSLDFFSIQATPRHEDDALLVRTKRKSERLTAYACENSRLNISCDAGQYLDIIRANYGRFSITICNDHGNTDWKVDCQAGRTLRAMQARCGNKNVCDVPVDSSIFGDPCPGTFKYIEVHYACRRDPIQITTTTSRPLPHWFPQVDSSQTDWSDLDNLGHNSTETNSTVVVDKGDLNQESATQKIIKVKVPKVPHNFDVIQRQSSLSKSHLPIDIPTSTTAPKSQTEKGVRLQVMANFTQYCPPIRSRGLSWNWTKAGDTSVMQCPQGSTGFAKWTCEHGRPQAEWAHPNPSLQECVSIWLSDLDSKLRSGSISVTNASKTLAENRQTLYGGDVILTTRMLKHMSERMHYDIQRTVDTSQREAMVTTLVKNVVRISSNLLNQENHKSWKDLGSTDNEIGRAVTALMVGLEENAFLLADSVTSEKIIIKPTENILLSIRVMQSRNTHRQKFPSVEENISTSWTSTGDSIELASQALLANGDNGAVRVVFAAYHQLNRLLELSSSQQRSRRKSFLNSRIICASLGRGRHIQLPEPVGITLRHLQPIDDARLAPQCVYWDYLSNDWSKDGCRVLNSNLTHTHCQCNHLTNFALLMTEGTRPVTSRGYQPEPVAKASPVVPKKAPIMSKNVSTIVAAIATLISICVIGFFVIMAWRKFRVSSQCRLGKNTLPCFHKSKENGDNINDNGTDVGDNESTKEKGNKGNFYTVTPKLNFNFNRNQNGSQNPNVSEDEAPELLEAQQFFEHMIALQKNQGTLVSKSSRRASANLNNVEEPDKLATNAGQTPNNLTINNLKRGSRNNKSEIVYPKRTNYARALSPYNHIYMEIDNVNNPGVQPEEQLQQQQQQHPPPLPPLPVYEPLSHLSETYMMSTLSDMSEGDYQFRSGLNSDVSRQSSHRENRPLIRNNFHQSYHPGNRNLLQTISGVLSSQSVRSYNRNDVQQDLRANRNWATLHHPKSHPRPILGVNINNQLVIADGTRTLSRLPPTHPNDMAPQQIVLEQIQPGQIQSPVHSQNVAVQGAVTTAVPLSSAVQPQFAHPVTSSSVVTSNI